MVAPVHIRIATLLGALASSGLAAERVRDAGAPGVEAGLAIRCAKALVVSADLLALDDARLLVRDGRIESVGRAAELPVPAGYEELDLGSAWVMPGLVDLHSHVAGSFDINGAVYQTNTGLRVKTSVVPGNARLERGLAGGVTTILFIPGSATAMGGEGVLLKTAGRVFEEMLVRDPGSLKLAQADNPKGWGWGMGRLTINWQIRDTLRRGLAYAKRWAAFEAGSEAEPALDPQWEVFRALLARRAQVSAHTQAYQVVAMTVRQVVAEAGLPLYIDHGTFDGFLAAEYAESLDVPAILGPRSMSSQNKGRGIDHDGRFLGVAAEYQRRGHSRIGFNTDAPIVPQEELALQSAMGVRYGFDDSEGGTILGLTLRPAQAAGIDDRVGSLERGKDADLVVLGGHPSDPRHAVELVFVEGRLVYDASQGRIW